MRVHEFAFRSIQGANMPLSRWKGQPLLLVNTASECGFTPQYEKLQALWTEYKPSGLVVIGIPCNDFGSQEPGDESAIHPSHKAGSVGIEAMPEKGAGRVDAQQVEHGR